MSGGSVAARLWGGAARGGAIRKEVPDPQMLLLSVVTRLLHEPIAARLRALGKAAAVLEEPGGSLVALFTPAFGEREAIGAELRSIVQRHPRTRVRLVLVGGDAELRALLPRGRPLAWGTVQRFHLAPDAEGRWSLWTGRGTPARSPLGEVLGAAARGELPAPDVAALLSRVEPRPPPSPEQQARIEEERAFVAGLRGPSWVTWGVMAVLVAVFACEVGWGGSETLPTLARMGANTEATPGEPWRLLSSALLHAGWAHLAINGFVLLVLGGFVERLLGAARYAVLLGAAAVGGSVASVLLSPAPLSVGASGAIWGVLGAVAVLTWRPGALIPGSLVGPLRRNAMINLVLNLAISFHPQVDLWAHLGGGLVGAGLVLGGVLTRGLGPVAVPEPEASAGTGNRRWFVIAAWGFAGLTAASLAAAWIVGRPWQLREPTAWAWHALGPVELEAPAELGEPTETPVPHDLVTAPLDAPAPSRWQLGDPVIDPLALDVTVIPYPVDPQALEREVLELSRHQPQTPPDAEVAVPWHAREGEGWPSFVVEYDYPSGLRQALWVQLRPDAELRIDSLRWPGLGDAWAAALERIHASLEHGPRPPAGATAPDPTPSPGR